MLNFSLWVLKSLGSYIRVLRVDIYQFERVIMDEKKQKQINQPGFTHFYEIEEIDHLITEIDSITKRRPIDYYGFSSSRYRLVTPWSKVADSAKLYLLCIIYIAE